MDKDYADKILEYKNDIKADVLKEVNRLHSNILLFVKLKEH